MVTQALMPLPSLQPFIRYYLIIESRNEITNRVLPNTSLAIAFRYKGQVSYVNEHRLDKLPPVTISGLRRSVRLINYAPDSAAVIVLFKEGGATAFFTQPLHELFEESISLDHFITSQQTAIIEEQLAEAKDNKQRIAIIEQFFLSRLVQQKQDKRILAALQKIKESNGNIKIKTLADNLYISQDAFEKRFRKMIGTSPKQFASIIRVKSVVNQKGLQQSLTQLAFDAGYYDQPHFSKDFTVFTGQTPADFFTSPVAFW